ncbi:MAG: phage tail protein [Pseudomonadota bacterium]|jgi:hypothetical protein
MSGSAGRTALTIAGQAVGFYFGGPIGAAVGSYLGSQAGYALFPLDPVEGPRLTDARLQTSQYGLVVPRVYGAARVAGNAIWASDIRETVRDEQVGGKGGPSQTVRIYSYDCDLAVGLCSGPMAGVRRIWADGRLIYDVSDPSDYAALVKSGETEAYFTFYPGDEAQLPDPTIEAALGVGNVPAYRGLSYIVWRQFQLEDYGNRIPQFTFEVVETGSPSFGRVVFESGALVSKAFANYNISPTLLFPRPIVTAIGATVRVTDTETAPRTVAVYDTLGNFLGRELPNQQEAELPPFSPLGGSGPPPAPWFGIGRLWNGARFELEALFGSVRVNNVPITLAGSRYALCADGVHVLAIAGGVNADNWLLYRWTGRSFVVAKTGTMDPITVPMGDFGFSPTSQTVGVNATCMLESDLQHMWQQVYGRVYVWRIDPDGVMRRVLSFVAGSGPTRSMNFNGAYVGSYANAGFAVFVGAHDVGGATVMYIYTRLSDGAATDRPLADVVTGLCLSAGLTAGQIDVTGLAGPVVPGMVLGAAVTARGALEPLSSVYGFIAVESGDKIRFALKTLAVAATIPADDLGDGDQPGVRVSAERAQESDLPARVTVTYMDTGADYQAGTQSARRVTTGSRQLLDVQVPLCLGPAQAAQAAERLLAEAWQSRVRRSFVTSRKWAAIEPGDVVVLDTNPRVTLRLVSRRDSGSRIEFDGVDHAAAIYTSTAAGIPVPGAGQIALVGPTRINYLDTASLRDEDDDAGIYVAAAGTGNTWPGARIDRSADYGQPWTGVASVSRAAVLGLSITALGNFTGGNVFDETNTVDVTLYTGTLSSATELQVLNYANAAWLGGEIIQFREATLLTGTTYRLSGLLRGRRGTERFIATHAATEPFALLDPAVLARVPLPIGDVSTSPLFRVTSFGAMPQENGTRVALTGAAIRPLAPAHLRAIRLGNDDILLQWVRRARRFPEWLDSVDVPLDESAERYDVEVWNTGNTAVLRAFTALPSPALTYTAAQQTADFGFLPTNLNVRVYQLSDRAGRGYPRAELLAAGFAPFFRDWTDGLTTGQTLFGSGPSHSVVAGVYQLNTAGAAAFSRLDNARSTADLDARLTVTLGGGVSRAGFNYRQTIWGGNNGSMAYVANVATAGGGIVCMIARGQNSVGGGAETTINSFFLAGPSSGTFRIRVRVVGTAHELYVDDVLRASGTDSTYTAAGQCGLYALGGTAPFDNLLIQY